MAHTTKCASMALFLFIIFHTCITTAFQVRPTFSFLSSRVSSSPLRDTEISSVSVKEDEITERVINISPKAMTHLISMKDKQSGDICLRMGVRAGGCSGMSYVMDFIPKDQITEEDHEEVYEGIRCVVDPKSILFLFGLQLDYSDELIGGGFKFVNPNAETSCGCGKSFGV